MKITHRVTTLELSDTDLDALRNVSRIAELELQASRSKGSHGDYTSSGMSLDVNEADATLRFAREVLEL